MIPRLRFRIVVITVCVVAFFASCKRSGVGAYAAVQDAISASGGNCVQTVNGSASSTVTIDHSGGQVQWTAPSATTSCTIHFDNNPASCPFYSSTGNQCDYSCTNGTVTSSPATGPRLTTYTYGSINIGGQNCNVNGNGIVLDH